MEGSGTGFGTGSVQLITDPDPGGPKTYRSYRSGVRNTTLHNNKNTNTFRIQYKDTCNYTCYHKV